MTEYFTEQRDNRDISKSDNEKYTATTEGDEETVQQEMKTVEEEDASTTIFAFPSDLDMWPKRLSVTDCEYWIQTGSKDCQHSNSNFCKSTRFYEGETIPRTYRDSYFQTIHRLTKSNMQEIGYAILKAKKAFLFSLHSNGLFAFGITK